MASLKKSEEASVAIAVCERVGVEVIRYRGARSYSLEAIVGSWTFYLTSWLLLISVTS